MAKREMYKEIDLGGRKWRIGRFDALTGSYITTLLMMQMLPMGMEDQMGLSSMAAGRSLMNKQTFFDVQKDCLRVVHELKLVGDMMAPMPLMLEDGRWGVADIENDVPTILGLTIQALVFNISDFFQEGALNDLTKVLSGLSPSNA